jgi:hypothetical protein
MTCRFAKLLLAGSPDSGTRDEVTADAKGQFRISGLALGNYTLTIRLQGFLDKTIRNVQVTAVEPRDVGNIVLGFAGCFAPGVICDDFGLGAPFIHVEATIEVLTNCGVDVDTGKTTCTARDSNSDFGVRLGENGEAYLVPRNGARLAVDTHGQWSLQDCVAAGYSSTEVRVDNLALGTRVCVLTNGNRYAELYGFVKSDDGASVRMTYLTWPGKSDPR